MTNPGGHSSRPVPDNAIYQLAAALGKVSAVDFPIEFNDATTGFFERMSQAHPDPRKAADMKRLPRARTPTPSAASGQNPGYNSILHTTCVATQLSAALRPTPCPSARAAATSTAASSPATPRKKSARRSRPRSAMGTVKVARRPNPKRPRLAPLTPAISSRSTS